MESLCSIELVQIDHMAVQATGMPSITSLRAICPVSKLMGDQGYDEATITIAGEFLKKGAKASFFQHKVNASR